MGPSDPVSRQDDGPNPFQTYLWERRTWGKPSRQAVCQKVCREGHCHQDRLFLDHRCNHKLCISTLAFLVSSSKRPHSAESIAHSVQDLISQIPIPLARRQVQGTRGCPPRDSRFTLYEIWCLFQYFIIVQSFNVVFVLALLLNQKGEETLKILILVLFIQIRVKLY